jgi:hypothetical protein
VGQLFGTRPEIGARGFGLVIQIVENIDEAFVGSRPCLVEGRLTLIHRPLACVGANPGRLPGRGHHLVFNSRDRRLVCLVLVLPLLLSLVDPSSPLADDRAYRADQEAVHDPKGHPEADHDEEQRQIWWGHRPLPARSAPVLSLRSARGGSS